MPFTLQSFISDYKAFFGSFIALDPLKTLEKAIIIPSYRSGNVSDIEYKAVVKHTAFESKRPEFQSQLAAYTAFKNMHKLLSLSESQVSLPVNWP